MNFNPFAFLIETKTYPMARFQRSSFWEKIKDTFGVFFGGRSYLEFYLPGEYKESVGLYDYLTFGISFFICILINIYRKLIFGLIQFLPKILPEFLLDIIYSSYLSLLWSFLALIAACPVIAILFVINLLNLITSAVLTLLVMPIVAFAHVYFSMQGEGANLQQQIFSQKNEQLSDSFEAKANNLINFIDSFPSWCFFLRVRYGVVEVSKSAYLSTTSRYFEEKGHYFEEVSESTYLSNPSHYFGELGRKTNIELFFRGTNMSSFEIDPTKANQLNWFRAILALNIFQLASTLEQENIFYKTRSLDSSLTNNNSSIDEPCYNDEYMTRLQLYLKLIDDMERFNLSEVVPSNVVPDDAFEKHVLAFL